MLPRSVAQEDDSARMLPRSPAPSDGLLPRSLAPENGLLLGRYAVTRPGPEFDAIHEQFKGHEKVIIYYKIQSFIIKL